MFNIKTWGMITWLVCLLPQASYAATIETWTARGICMSSYFVAGSVGNTGYSCGDAYDLLLVPTIEVEFKLTFDASMSNSNPAAFVDFSIIIDPDEFFGSAAIIDMNSPSPYAVNFDPENAHVTVQFEAWKSFSASPLYWDVNFSEDEYLLGQVIPFADTSNIWTLTTVPVPTAVWLFISGLTGLISVAMRKKDNQHVNNYTNITIR